jgi:GNAT superfamily N-acetyltransferase
MVAYLRYDSASTAQRHSALVRLYALVYAEPPYREGPEQVEHFRTRFTDDAQQPGFSLVTAEDDERLVGAAYGWTMPAGSWWPGADDTDIAAVDKFAVLEWLVDPHYRSKGIGGRLFRHLLQDRPEPLATLAADPRSPARAIYARAGWRQAGTLTLAWGTPMDLLVIET